MRKFTVLIITCVILAGIPNVVGVIRDKALLRNQIIRLHVVGQSDSEADQNLKLYVKDAVVQYLRENIPQDIDTAQAKACLQQLLEKLQDVANLAVKEAGGDECVGVSLEKEAFPQRKYDTFSLPSGVYESLRITIGEGNGKNWWCVVFPSLCLGTTVEEYRSLAVGAGLSESVVSATAGDEPYEIRFFLLDCIGKLENFFHFR